MTDEKITYEELLEFYKTWQQKMEQESVESSEQDKTTSENNQSKESPEDNKETSETNTSRVDKKVDSSQMRSRPTLRLSSDRPFSPQIVILDSKILRSS